MKKAQVQLIQRSWLKIEPLAQQAGEMFYQKLFNSEPLLRHLFRGDIKEQAAKMTNMLRYVVAGLNRPDSFRADLEKLGQRHVSYGAQPEHYQAVGECLISVLAEGLGKEWTPELATAWTEFIHWIAEIMQGD